MTNLHKALIAAVFSAVVCLPAAAKDLGVQGQLWPITEVDFRELVIASALNADWNKAGEDIRASVDRYFDGFPRRILPSVEKTETHYIDPSITTESDIMAPVADAEGNLRWEVQYPKGTKANPLTKVRPLTAMLFFDGSSEEQLKFVREALAVNPMRIVPVETAGANVKTLSKRFSRPVFYANDSMLSRFKVAHLPALLYPASGDFALYLGMTEFAAPYKVTEVEAVWPATPRAGDPVIAIPVVTPAEREAIRNLLQLNKSFPHAK